MNFKITLGILVFVALSAVAFMYMQKTVMVPKIVMPQQKMWGAYTGNTAGSFIDFEKRVGKKANLNAVFPDWGSPFPLDLALPVKNAEQTILIFWEPNISLDQIISGSEDLYMSSFANQANAYSAPIILIPMEEMNGNWNAWNGTVGNNTPQKFILAWHHMHNLFSGAANVKWGWDVNSDSIPNTIVNTISNYWPGAKYVDYVGVDGFNFGNPWQSFSEIFSPTLQKLKKYNKPIYIFSMACAEGPLKSVWIADALSKIKSDPKISGWVWFNENKEQNWLMDSDAAALTAFKNNIK